MIAADKILDFANSDILSKPIFAFLAEHCQGVRENIESSARMPR